MPDQCPVMPYQDLKELITPSCFILKEIVFCLKQFIPIPFLPPG